MRRMVFNVLYPISKERLRKENINIIIIHDVFDEKKMREHRPTDNDARKMKAPTTIESRGGTDNIIVTVAKTDTPAIPISHFFSLKVTMLSIIIG